MSVQYEFLNTVRRMKVTSEAATTLHKRLLPGETREVGLRATGSGVAVIEVGYQYNLNVTAAWPSFVVNPFVTKVRCSFTNRSVNAQKFSQYFGRLECLQQGEEPFSAYRENFREIALTALLTKLRIHRAVCSCSGVRLQPHASVGVSPLPGQV